MNWGVTLAGFVRKRFNDIWNDMKDMLVVEWRSLTGVTPDISDDNPDVVVSKISAMEADILWRAAQQVMRSGFTTTANGAALDDRVKDRGMVRMPAHPSRGVLIVSGAPETVYEASKLEIRGPNGKIYHNEFQFTIPVSGKIGVDFVSQDDGADTRLEAGVPYTDVRLNAEISSEPTTHTMSVGVESAGFLAISPSETFLDYQKVLTSGILCPTRITGFVLVVRNPAETARQYYLQLRILDDSSGEPLDFTSIMLFSLQGGESKNLVFSNEAINVGSATAIRVAPRLLVESDGILEVGKVAPGNDTERYYINGVPQSYALDMQVVSGTTGRMDGGRDTEYDEELRARHDDELDRGGGGRLGAIRARVRELPGVRTVRVIENSATEDPYVLTSYWGDASVIDVAREIARAKSAGVPTAGNRTVSFEDDDGETQTLKLSVATEVPIYAQVLLRPQPVPANTESTARQALTEYIGGADEIGVLHTGVPVGAKLYISEALVWLRQSLPGIPSVDILWGRSPTSLKREDLEFSIEEKPVIGEVFFV